MSRVILITFGFLGWAWYEVSGGSEFVPGSNGVQVLAEYTPAAREAAPQETLLAAAERVIDGAPAVTRSEGLGSTLTDVSSLAPLIKPEPGQDAEADKLAALITSNIRGDAVVPAAQVVNVAAASTIDYRAVTGNRVNLRQGPGTGFEVVTKLVRGDEVEVLLDGEAGWVKLRTLKGSEIGWMSADFLARIN